MGGSGFPPMINNFKTPSLRCTRLGSATIGATTSRYPNRRRKPDEFYDEAKLFKYRLVPFPAMKATWSVRQPAHVVSGFSPQTQVQQFHHPFKDLPAISLHVPCHFVICDTAQKLMSFYGGSRPTADKLKLDFPSTFTPIDRFVVSVVWDLYGEAWMCVRPDAEWKSIVGQLTIGFDGGGHDGPSGPSSHVGNEGGGGQGLLLNENDGPPQGAPGGADAVDHPFGRPLPTSSLAPEDSASCRDVAGGEEAPADEDEEWEDLE
ncbi:hypothetical protein K466DRAFT_364273 [Polyporus arcularius HHB13444]|uniref:Uncharacterized protein n=1 Tax=Polyporus arcularius HHB13444 TaxID=1314778 RepID=A0A5C3NUB1_9APHY|nr:hypothetical protein K466DRAFT_364273 [Polyporus arcularius HHB13444]